MLTGTGTIPPSSQPQKYIQKGIVVVDLYDQLIAGFYSLFL
ncbi:hypothetical protein L8C07_25950 [Paenibacillus sp. CMAA1739]|nr:hypothetical protein [Paenibacillus sp. CMAA1739]MEC4569393.1 hypothetical protein [Paenibacillus sp. CMAA1739]